MLALAAEHWCICIGSKQSQCSSSKNQSDRLRTGINECAPPDKKVRAASICSNGLRARQYSTQQAQKDARTPSNGSSEAFPQLPYVGDLAFGCYNVIWVTSDNDQCVHIPRGSRGDFSASLSRKKVTGTSIGKSFSFLQRTYSRRLAPRFKNRRPGLHSTGDCSVKRL